VKPAAPLFRGEVEYSSGESDFPVPTKVDHRVIAANGFNEIYIYTFKDMQRVPTPALEFLLAGYGLGDLEAPVRPRTNVLPYFFFGLAAVALFALLALNRYKMRRSTVSP